ncbi:MAG: DUF6512 family protein [Mycobacterium sp.]|nr:DUF6512 family protein [Mycobacterium sp.]
MPRDALLWALAGIPVVIIGGTLLHFCFECGGRRRALAVFCPINESVWEHLKMAYWPLLAMTGLQLAVAESPPLLAATRATGFYTMGVLILGLYFLTAALLPHVTMRTRLVMDGAIFVLAVVIGQLVSAAVPVMSERPGVVWAGWIALFAPAAIFASTTFAPPHVELFRDQITGSYGLTADGPRGGGQPG